MKKAIIIFTLLLLAIPVFAADNLWQYYSEKGEKLPSVSERAVVYSNIAKDEYKGTYGQNMDLLLWLEEGSQVETKPDQTSFDFFNIFSRFGYPFTSNLLGGNIPASAINWTLATPITASLTTIDVSNFKDLRGNAIATSSFPTKVYFVIEPENSNNTEIVMCLALNCDDTNTQCTSCTRGLAFSGTSESSVTANKKAHPSGARVIMTNVGQFFNNFIDIDSAQTIGGIKTFSSIPVLPGSDPTDNNQATRKYYVDNLVNQGAATSTETTSGISQLATQDEMASSTDNGADEPLVLQAKYATSSMDVAGKYVVVTENDGKINQNFIDLTENFDFTGENSFSATTTFTSNIIGAPNPFYGNGSDGILDITSGTTTIDFNYATSVLKQYTSLSIAAGAGLEVSNAGASGTLFMIRVLGKCTINGTIELSGAGSKGGAGGGVEGNGGLGSYSAFLVDNTNDHSAGGGEAGDHNGSTQAGGAAGAIFGNKEFFTTPDVNRLSRRSIVLFVGSGGGGGGGGGYIPASTGGVGGSGGRGGGAILLACNSLVFTGRISVNGQNGANGASALCSGGACAGGGGGGGGGAGSALILYNTLVSNTGTITATGGSGGSGGISEGQSTNCSGGGGGGSGGGFLAAGKAGGAGMIESASGNGTIGDAGVGSSGGGGEGEVDGGAAGSGGGVSPSNSQHYLIAQNLWY